MRVFVRCYLAAIECYSLLLPFIISYSYFDIVFVTLSTFEENYKTKAIFLCSILLCGQSAIEVKQTEIQSALGWASVCLRRAHKGPVVTVHVLTHSTLLCTLPEVSQHRKMDSVSPGGMIKCMNGLNALNLSFLIHQLVVIVTVY